MVMKKMKEIIGTKADFAMEQVKIPFLRLIFNPFVYLMDNLKAFFVSAAFYSAILTLASAVFGTFFLCGFEKVQEQVSCSFGVFSNLSYVLLKTFCLLLFFSFYYQVLLGEKGAKIEWRNLYKLDKSLLKILVALIGVGITCAMPFLSLYILMIREPNPDWVIEISFFAVVSLGFLVPFATMRLLSFIGQMIEGQEKFSLLAIWMRTSENMFKIIFALSFVIMFFLVFLMNFYYGFATHQTEGYGSILLAEFIYDILFFLSAALFIGHVKAQTKYVIHEDYEEK
ncbi:MAG: hypothetical protein PHE89_00040 [Alphaproteobacteria bacterium]|nr:hypothetical protein [Alphaproteobacteria bacterium]